MGSWITYVQQGAAVAGAIGLAATITNLSYFTSSGKITNIAADVAAIGYGVYMFI